MVSENRQHFVAPGQVLFFIFFIFTSNVIKKSVKTGHSMKNNHNAPAADFSWPVLITGHPRYLNFAYTTLTLSWSNVKICNGTISDLE